PFKGSKLGIVNHLNYIGRIIDNDWLPWSEAETKRRCHVRHYFHALCQLLEAIVVRHLRAHSSRRCRCPLTLLDNRIDGRDSGAYVRHRTGSQSACHLLFWLPGKNRFALADNL